MGYQKEGMAILLDDHPNNKKKMFPDGGRLNTSDPLTKIGTEN